MFFGILEAGCPAFDTGLPSVTHQKRLNYLRNVVVNTRFVALLSSTLLINSLVWVISIAVDRTVPTGNFSGSQSNLPVFLMIVAGVSVNLLVMSMMRHSEAVALYIEERGVEAIDPVSIVSLDSFRD